MLKNKMYVRCPADKDSMNEPRVFVCGQIVKINAFKGTVSVKINDPFGNLIYFESLPKGIIELPVGIVDRCKFFINSIVLYNGNASKVMSCQKSDDGYYYYYLQNVDNKEIKKKCESEIIAAFNNGQVDPCIQLKNYEFQNPVWYLGHAVVSKSMNILDNSIYGFKELAGAKIYLLPHQVNTIMRCLQDEPCRYMLADEVGMGKTIEAISVYKIFTMQKSNTKALIIVPKSLKEQWISELLLKFNISNGKGKNNNSLIVKGIEDLNEHDWIEKWDFVIIDEVHKFISDELLYSSIHRVSKNSLNLLVLSATPVQQKREEYLALLRILFPDKYDNYDENEFRILIDKQRGIIQKTALVLDSLSDFEDEIEECDEEDKHNSEICQELFEDIRDEISEICEDLADPKLMDLYNKIIFEDEDLGIYAIKVTISYICSNYQIESNIIRNRRRILEKTDDDVKLLATRNLIELEYSLENEESINELTTYNEMSNWVVRSLQDNNIDVEKDVKPLLSSFFSSPWAFMDEVKKLSDNYELLDRAREWLAVENENLKKIKLILDDPCTYESSYSSRLVLVVNALYDEFYDKKVVLFTNYSETFKAYKEAIERVFDEKEVSFFSEDMQMEDIELNSYRFQTEDKCRIMLCDYTGGEGRNFQCADYVIHIDLPWDASLIEQRIGRLDRLERDLSRPVVYSVVVYAKGTFEEAIFSFFRDGLKIFNQSLSGMEIIMKDINEEIISAIKDDFKYGLFDRIPHIVELANFMKEEIRKEQNFDAAGFIFRPMYSELRRLIDYYSRNENDLFASAMTNWASLAGFKGSTNKNGVVTYSANSFSPASAIKSQLIPPKWNDYLNLEHNKVITKVQDAFDKQMKRNTLSKAIKGTFSRKTAIENDYLHFFAPGDDVFDSIVDNAINSCKGCSGAMAISGDINWTGLIYTWSISPNIAYLLDNNIPLFALNTYRNFLISEQSVIPITISNPDGLSDDVIIREYNKIIGKSFSEKNHIVHLGKRKHEAKFMNEIISGRNIDWFKSEYKEEYWVNFIYESRKEAYNKAV